MYFALPGRFFARVRQSGLSGTHGPPSRTPRTVPLAPTVGFLMPTASPAGIVMGGGHAGPRTPSRHRRRGTIAIPSGRYRRGGITQVNDVMIRTIVCSLIGTLLGALLAGVLLRVTVAVVRWTVEPVMAVEHWVFYVG